MEAFANEEEQKLVEEISAVYFDYWMWDVPEIVVQGLEKYFGTFG